MSYIKQNKKRNQALEIAQYGLEITIDRLFSASQKYICWPMFVKGEGECA